MDGQYSFSHLRHVTEAEWQQVRDILNADELARGWKKAFAAAQGGSASQTQTARRGTEPDKAWGRAFEKAGAVRRK